MDVLTAEKLLKNPNDLLKIVNKMLLNKHFSWSVYDRSAIEEVMKTNSYVFSAISKISKACVNINLLVGRYDNGVFVQDEENGLAKLLEHPNIILDKKEFIESCVFWYYPFGECFIYGGRYEGGANKGQIFSDGLWFSPPQYTDIQADGLIPTGYVLSTDTSKVIPAYNMLHLKAFNPDFTDLHGLPYLEVSGKLIDKLNSIDDMEVNSFLNSGPNYLLSPKEQNSLSEPEFQNILSKFKSMFKKKENKGGMVGTSAMVDLKEVGKSPVDLGTIESQKNTLRMLCSVWGLDPGLFDVETSTYNNKQEINKSIYTEAAIPFMERLASKLTHWLGEAYGGVEVIVDTSNVEVLQPNYEKKSVWMTTANVFSDNEIREALGYDRIDDPQADLTPAQKLDMDAIQGFEPTSLEEEVVK